MLPDDAKDFVQLGGLAQIRCDTGRRHRFVQRGPDDYRNLGPRWISELALASALLV